MKRHSLDILSLVFGLIFLLVAVSWIVQRSVDVELPGPGWYVAGALIVAGLFGIASTLREPRAAKAQPEQLPPYQPAPESESTHEFGTVTESKPED